MNYKFAQLLIQDPHHSLKTGEILIQPSSEVANSDLIILIEIDSNTPADQQFIQYFLELAYGIYEQSGLHQTEKILENILAGLNEQLLAFNHNKGFDWLNKLHCFIGLLYGNTIHFATFGKINTFLIRQTLIKNISATTYPENKKILFDTNLSGPLKFGDRFLITTESLTNYLSLEKIKKTVAALPPLSAVAHFTNILEATPPTVSFFSIILQFIQQTQQISETNLPLKGKLAIPTGSKNSLDQLLKTQAETEKILTPPSFLEILKEKLKRQSPKTKASIMAKPAAPNLNKTAKVSLPLSRKMASAPPKQTVFFIWLKKAFFWLIKILKNIWLYLVEKSTRRQFNKKLTNAASRLIKKFNQLSRAHKIIAVSVIVLVLLFSQSLIWQGQRVKSLKIKEAYQNTLNQINEKKTGIEAVLIYDNTRQARQLLNEANALLKQLTQNSKDRVKQYQQLNKEIQTIFVKIWKITNILEPLVLIDFKQINPAAEITGLNLKDNYLYAFNNTNQPFAVNLETNKNLVLDKLNLAAKKTGFFALANRLMAVAPDNKFYSLEENEMQEIPVSLPSELKQIDDLTFYFNKMYLLDRAAKQIFRLSYSGKDFISPISWLKESLPVDQTMAITVDGFVYALQTNGSILKIAGGKNQNFPPIIIEPQFNNPSKIFTEEQSQNLYILDPQNNRVVVLAKDTGEIKNQYYSEKFNNLKDLIVREKEKKAYLLNGSQVLVIALQ